MAPFPSPDELIVASALLLLSTTESVLEESAFDCESTNSKKKAIERSLSLASRGSSKLIAKSFMSALCGESNVRICAEEDSESSKPKSKSSSSSCSASSVINCTSSTEIHAHRPLRINSRSHEMTFKVVKKSRTKVSWIADHRKTFTSENAPCKTSSPSSYESESTEVPCLSINSSAMESRLVASCGKRKAASSPTGSSSGSSSSQMKRRAHSIMELLSSGCFSEVEIRKVLGDNPDTSKALRMLLKLEEVKRSGTGGRHDPYIYMIA